MPSKLILLSFLCSILCNIKCWATKPSEIHRQTWSDCEQEFTTREYPRTCLIIGIQALKLGHKELYIKIEEYCLANIKLWMPLDSADQLIVDQYYPRCSYRYKTLVKETVPGLSLNLERANLVRFLYLQDQDDNSAEDPKRLSNPLTTRTRP